MVQLPKIITEAWQQRNNIVVLTTTDKSGLPNAIYATCAAQYNANTYVIADNYMNKTRKNILEGSKASLLFMTKEGTAYQLKGKVVYHKHGPIFDNMKTWNPAQHPGQAAVAIEVDEAYCGAEILV